MVDAPGERYGSSTARGVELIAGEPKLIHCHENQRKLK